jgi:threonine/homoserine/homoserine lactone efflux protein
LEKANVRESPDYKVITPAAGFGKANQIPAGVHKKIEVILITLFTIFASSFVIALSGALMPGPLLTATISESSRRGFIMGPLLIGGHAILELALVIALLMGLAPFFQQPVVFVATALAGSAILFWMAFGMFRTLPSLRLSWEGDQKRLNHPVISGILMSIANPYWIIWWATIGLGYILYSWQFGLWGVAFFFAGHILADLVWYSLVAAAVAGGKHFLTDRLYRGLIAACAVFLVVFAGYFAYAGFEKLRVIIA